MVQWVRAFAVKEKRSQFTSPAPVWTPGMPVYASNCSTGRWGKRPKMESCKFSEKPCPQK